MLGNECSEALLTVCAGWNHRCLDGSFSRHSEELLSRSEKRVISESKTRPFPLDKPAKRGFKGKR